MASSAGVGTVYTSSQAAKQLYSNNRTYNNQQTWSALFNSNDVAAGQAQQQLTNSYTDATVDAYVSALQSKQALKNSNIVGSYQDEAMAAYDASLRDTVDQYYSNYLSNQNSLEEARSENEESIYNALMEQADYTANYTNYHYDYLEYLWEEYQNNGNYLFNDANWSKYLTHDPQVDDAGNVLKDSDGNILYEDDARLMTREELNSQSIFDENGNLTMAGIDFFDQLENSGVSFPDDTTSQSWGDWLAETDQDTYDWANSYNYYNYTKEGTNAGTMRTMYGMMSDDYTYAYLERFGGMSSDRIDAALQKIQDALNEYDISEKKYGRNSDNTKDLANNMFDVIEESLKDLGMMEMLEANGLDWSAYKSQMLAYIESGSTDANHIADVALSTGSGATVGAVVGASAGLGVISGITGVIGALAGAAIGFVSGMLATVDSRKKDKATNKQIAQDVVSDFEQLLINFTDIKTQLSDEMNTIKVVY